MTHRHVMTEVHSNAATQRGVILLITLVSLVILLLAATALIRSTNTAALIAGNLALRQSSVASSDRAVSEAVALLATYGQVQTDPWSISSNPFNITAAPYYSTLDPALDLTASSTWQDGTSSALNTPDAGGNQSRYIIQRVCRPGLVVPIVTGTWDTWCLLNYVNIPKGSFQLNKQSVTTPPSNMVFRITVRTIGPRNTISYTQAFVN
jgi:Tfp pilus assembly protein PilX